MNDPRRIYYVYVLYRPWDNSACYVGKGKGDRCSAHQRLGDRHSNKNLARIFKKAARLGLKVRVQKLYCDLSEADALETEIALIKKLGRKPNGPLVNLTNGGDGGDYNLGRKFSAEHRARISAALKGHVVSDTSKKVASLTHKGKTLSAEHRAAISKAQQGNLNTAGLRHSAESREKMSAQRRGKPKSPEHRAAIGAAHLARRARIALQGQ